MLVRSSVSEEAELPAFRDACALANEPLALASSNDSQFEARARGVRQNWNTVQTVCHAPYSKV